MSAWITTAHGRLATALGAGLSTALFAVALSAPAEAGAMHTLVNPSFTDGLTGWYESTTLGEASIVAGRSGNSARLTHKATTPYTVILNDTKNTVSSTMTGATYTATAWVRASAPTPVTIRLQEWKAGKQGELVSTQTVGTTWTQIGISYAAKTAGASLDLNVLAPNMAVGTTVDVDDLTFRSRTATFADEFDGTTLNTTNWAALNNSTFGDGNGELACLTSRPANLTVANGLLTMTAQKENPLLKCGSIDTRFPNGRSYSSAFVQSKGKKSFTYGRFEMRAKLPTAQGTTKGLWPAFWMRPDDGGVGELDIMEALGSGATGTESTKVHQTLHYDYVKTYPSQSVTYTFPTGSQPSDGFHTYAVEWDPGQIQWFIDGRLVTTKDTTSTAWMDSAFNRPMYLRLNMAIGGSWPGSPDASTVFPSSYQIDYVRVNSPAVV